MTAFGIVFCALAAVNAYFLGGPLLSLGGSLAEYREVFGQDRFWQSHQRRFMMLAVNSAVLVVVPLAMGVGLLVAG